MPPPPPIMFTLKALSESSSEYSARSTWQPYSLPAPHTPCSSTSRHNNRELHMQHIAAPAGKTESCICTTQQHRQAQQKALMNLEREPIEIKVRAIWQHFHLCHSLCSRTAAEGRVNAPLIGKRADYFGSPAIGRDEARLITGRCKQRGEAVWLVHRHLVQHRPAAGLCARPPRSLLLRGKFQLVGLA